MTKRAIFLIVAMAATGVPLLTAQSNEVLDTVLGEAALSYANAAYIVGMASGHIPETTALRRMFPGLEQAGFGIPGRQPSDP